MKQKRPEIPRFALFFLLFAITACHSYHIETTVVNRSSAAIELLEVDYPSATFGINNLPPGGRFNYRIQVRGSGPLKVQYSGPDGRQLQVEGPLLTEQEQGQLEIVLLPGGKVEFHPQLTSSTAASQTKIQTAWTVQSR